MIVDLYRACVPSEVRRRPSAVEILRAIEEAISTIPGAVPAGPDTAEDSTLLAPAASSAIEKRNTDE